jgi:hypothetical protein
MERLPCNPDIECKYREAGECKQDTHHLYWPRRNYIDPVAKKFRELVINKVVVCRQIHDDIHATQKPPKKPNRNQMLEALNEQV